MDGERDPQDAAHNMGNHLPLLPGNLPGPVPGGGGTGRGSSAERRGRAGERGGGRRGPLGRPGRRPHRRPPATTGSRLTRRRPGRPRLGARVWGSRRGLLPRPGTFPLRPPCVQNLAPGKRPRTEGEGRRADGGCGEVSSRYFSGTSSARVRGTAGRDQARPTSGARQ